MRIEWLGHATFKVINDDITIIFDPYADGFVPGLKNLREEANFVFSSHGHNDHNAVDLVNIIEKEANFKLTVLDSFHDDNNGNDTNQGKDDRSDDNDNNADDKDSDSNKDDSNKDDL